MRFLKFLLNERGTVGLGLLTIGLSLQSNAADPVVPAGSGLLIEAGDDLLLETGDRFLLET